MGDAGRGQPFERAMQLDRIRRRQRAVGVHAGAGDAERADARGAAAEPRPDLPDEGRDRSLAAGSGDRDDGRGLAREQAGGGERQRAPGVGDAHEGHALGQRRIGGAFGENRDRAGRNRIGNETQAVRLGAVHRDEQVPTTDFAAVGRHTGHVEAGMAGIDRGRVAHKISKFHRRRAGCAPRGTAARACRAVTAAPWRSSGSAGRPAADRTAARPRAGARSARSLCPSSAPRSSRKW